MAGRADTKDNTKDPEVIRASETRQVWCDSICMWSRRVTQGRKKEESRKGQGSVIKGYSELTMLWHEKGINEHH